MHGEAKSFLLAALAAAVVMGCASPPRAALPESAFRPGKSIVRSVRGLAEYKTGDSFQKLRVNMELPSGTIIQTDNDSEAYLQVNGFASTVKITRNSIVELTKINVRNRRIGADSETVLTVKQGKVLGSVRKLSAVTYEIHAPNGVAAIRGTDFSVEVDPLPTGQFKVTYACVTGQVVVSAEVAGATVTKTLNTDDSWVPGEGDVVNNPPPRNNIFVDPLPVGIQIITPVQSPPPVVLQQPYNGAGAPNPAVDVGRNPFARNPPPMVHPIGPEPEPSFPVVTISRH